MEDMDDIQDFEHTKEEIRNIFCDSNDILSLKLINISNQTSACECSHKSRIKLFDEKIFWLQRMAYFYKIVLVILCLVLLSLIYGFWVMQHLNRTRIYGGCLSSYFWPIDECLVAF